MLYDDPVEYSTSSPTRPLGLDLCFFADRSESEPLSWCRRLFDCDDFDAGPSTSS